VSSGALFTSVAEPQLLINILILLSTIQIIIEQSFAILVDYELDFELSNLNPT